jgi:hypothetical protein
VHALFAWAGASLRELGSSAGATVDAAPIDVAASGHLIVRETGRALRRIEPGTYRRAGESGLTCADAAPSGLPSGPGEVVIWPSGAAAGGPEEDRLRLLFAESVVGRSGLSEIAEAAVAWLLGDAA